MTADATQGWQTRPNKSWSGIRLYNDSTQARVRRANAVDCIIIHQWGANASLSEDAWNRINRGETTETEEWHARMARTPYHFGAHHTSKGHPIAAQVWPAGLHTHHAGAMNRRSIGVGVVGLFERFDRSHGYALAQAIQDAVTAAAQAVLAMAPSHYSEGTCPAPVLLRTHSQTSTKERDPGEQIIMATAPMVRAGIVRVEPEWSTGKGQPWPEEWRRHVR